MFGLLLRVIQTFIQFIIRTVVIYSLGIEYLGLNSLFASVLQVLNLAELGIGSAMVFSMYKPIAEDDTKTICAMMALYRTYYRVIGLIIAVSGAALVPFLPYLIKSDLPPDINPYIIYLLNLTAAVLSYWLFAYKNAILQAHQRTDISSKVGIAASVFQAGLHVVSVAVFKSYYAFAVSSLFIQALTNVLTAFFANKLYPQYKPYGKLEKKAVSEINRRIRDLFSAKLGSVIVGSADSVVISAFLGLTVLAVYQNYYYIISALYTFVGIIFSSVTAGIGNSLATESIEKNYKDFRVFSFALSWIICVNCSCLAGMYQPFMEIWVGKEFLLDDSFIPLLCVYSYVLELSMVWATVKDAAGLWHKDRFRPLIGALTNLGMNIILVQFIGLYGVVLSTVISYVLISMPWMIYNLFRLLYKRSPWGYIKDLIGYLSVTALSAALCFFISQIIRTNAYLHFFLMGVLGIALSNLILFLFLHKKEEYLESKRLALRMIRRHG